MKYLAMLVFLVSCGPKVGECYKRYNYFGGITSKVKEVHSFGVVMGNQYTDEFYRTFKDLDKYYKQVDCISMYIKD